MGAGCQTKPGVRCWSEEGVADGAARSLWRLRVAVESVQNPKRSFAALCLSISLATGEEQIIRRGRVCGIQRPPRPWILMCGVALCGVLPASRVGFGQPGGACWVQAAGCRCSIVASLLPRMPRYSRMDGGMEREHGEGTTMQKKSRVVRR